MVCTAWGPDKDAGLNSIETGVCTFSSIFYIFSFVVSLGMEYTNPILPMETVGLKIVPGFSKYIQAGILAFLVAGCQLASTVDPQIPMVDPSATVPISTAIPLILLDEPTATATANPPEAATETPAPLPSATPTETALPDGFGFVPDLRGIPLSEARLKVSEAGFSFLFQDVLDPEQPTGTIVDQDPPAGVALPLGDIIFLFRSFPALEMYAGGACQPLNILAPAGKLLYWVALDEGIRYEVRTDFAYGRTQISDYRMYLMAEFDNANADSIIFKPLAPGRYVISLGPYEVSKTKLQDEGSLSAGCLWITPEDLN